MPESFFWSWLWLLVENNFAYKLTPIFHTSYYILQNRKKLLLCKVKKYLHFIKNPCGNIYRTTKAFLEIVSILPPFITCNKLKKDVFADERLSDK